MNPLLSFWIKVQPLSNSLSCHTWKAISQTSTLAPSSGDDTIIQRTNTTSSSWAFDYFMGAATRLITQVKLSSSSWLLNPMICRMNDAVPPILPSSKNNVAFCEAGKRYPSKRRGVGSSRAKSFSTTTTTSTARQTPLQQSQQLLQQQDYINYQIPIQPIRRRNSKDWVQQYKKERIDKINFNNVFGGIVSSNDRATNEIPTLSPPTLEEEESNSSKYNMIHHHPPSPTTILADCVGSSSSIPPPVLSSKSIVGNNNNNNNKTSAIHDIISTPSPVDVICGRGGKANTHQGNISFRDEARKLRNWYESSSKSEKFTISSFLVDVVRERGGRFLKRDTTTTSAVGDGKEGRWVECDGNDVRKKASQALREGRTKGQGQ